jgi:hypothetical protein
MNMARFQLEIKLKKTTLRFCPTLLTSIKTILQLIFFLPKQQQNNVMFMFSRKDSTSTDNSRDRRPSSRHSFFQISILFPYPFKGSRKKRRQKFVRTQI